MMNIGLDVDDTINYSPRFFTYLTKNKNFMIYIITGRSKNSSKITLDLLKQLDINFQLLSMFPINKCEFNKKSELREVISEWKVKQAKELNINVFFDNDEKTLKKMKEAGILAFRRL